MNVSFILFQDERAQTNALLTVPDRQLMKNMTSGKNVSKTSSGETLNKTSSGESINKNTSGGDIAAIMRHRGSLNVNDYPSQC